MNDTFRLVAFTMIGISALFSLIWESKKSELEKDKSLIVFESLVIIGVAWMLIGIFM
jgi:tryptophan-rich sensory protein